MQFIVFHVASVEVTCQHCGILLHVENLRQIHATEKIEGCRKREQTETSLHSKLVSVACSVRPVRTEIIVGTRMT